MALYIIYIVCIILFFRSMYINTTGGVFDKSTSESLKGMAMVAIILHHIHNNVEMNSLFFSLIGFMATAVFFFISGYGNSVSLRGIHDKNGSLQWLAKRVRIYGVFLISYIVYAIVLFAFYHENFPIIVHATNVLTFTLPNQITWFPKVYLATVLIHSVMHYFAKKEKVECIILLCASLGWIAIAWMCGLPSFWYNSIMCYVTGSFCCIYSENLKRVGMKKRGVYVFLIGMICLLTALYCLPNRPLQIIAPVGMCVTLYMIFVQWGVQSLVLRYIGKHSFEFYCFHIVALEACSALINKGNTMYSVAVIILSILMVCVYSAVANIAKGHIKRTIQSWE